VGGSVYKHENIVDGKFSTRYFFIEICFNGVLARPGSS
jgi:hypothetical protein